MFRDAVDTLFYTPPLLTAFAWATLGNIAMFVLALVAGEALVRANRDKLISQPAPPISHMEIILATVCVVFNSVVAYVGILLWRAGIIQLRPAESVTAPIILLDVLVLFMAMDFAMYVFHRIAHHPLLFPIIHLTHHQYENPRPLTLFVLNPFEVLGFGALWIVVVTVYHSSAEGILIYLAFNLVFGMVGHLGVEPAPGQWIKLPLLRYVSTSTFHAEHHLDKEHNFGFYTLIWDRLFGTLSPDYTRDFERAQS